MKRIQRLSLVLQIIFALIFLWLPVYTCVYWLSNGLPFGAKYPINYFLYSGPPLPYVGLLPTKLKIYGLFINMVPIILYMTLSGLLVRLFYLYWRFGEIVSARVASLYKMTALVFLATQLVRPFYCMLLSYVLSAASPAGGRFIFFSFSLQDVIMISVASLGLLIAWIIEEYHELQEEQGYTV